MLFYFAHWMTIIFAFGAAPLILLASLMHKRKFKNVILAWQKPALVVFTIASFIVGLLAFIVGSFFLASYIGKLDGIEFIDINPDTIYLLAIDNFILVFGIVLFFLAAKNYFMQYVTTEGIIIQKWEWKKMRLVETRLLWEQINDYYIKSDYPLSIFTFITLRNNSIERISLAVPFYALSIFEQQIESQMDFAAFHREQMRKFQKNNPNPMF